VRFRVLTPASIKMAVFLHLAPCAVIDIGRRFRGVYCVYRQGDGVCTHTCAQDTFVGMTF
jgi:hypothetical protein